ncbi:hypothetical protein CBR_g32506 [Chara braunii]|uniref:Integrase catalytic domain-containing protein n=1 Tax=Chara braunii TaxID=69332 RepID=A0A388LGW8_CHABU|nr:hypothetical protein CBR_g32506 [Chara braunii]|eukprot:GBG81517.1 hypothetical protein CBR_g32506 [Chara braunii]
MVSTMRSRPVLKRSAPTVAVQTRVRRRNEQLQKEKESEKASEEEPISISENKEDNEDEKLRAEEEERARSRALEREPEKGKAEVSEEEPRKKKNIYSIPVEQGVDIEQLVNKILESQRDLVTLKEILAVSSKIREEFKQRITRKRVMTVKLGEVIPPEANWSPPGTKMDWRSVSTGHMKVQIGRQEYSALVDDGVEMNIIRERHAIEAGLKINRDDYGFLVGASGSTPFCGTASGVLVTIGKVKVRSYFYVLLRVEHEVLLGRAFPTRHGKSIWNAPAFHEVRPELVVEEPFIEEDPWGEQTAEEMMRLALNDDIDLMLDPLTIEQGHTQADDAFQTVGRMSYIMNLLVHEDCLRLMNAEEGGSEVKEAFKEKEYEGEYKKIGMWLNGELDESEVDPVVRETSKGFVVRDGHLFKKAADGVPKRVRSNIHHLEPLNPRYVAEPGAVVHLDLLVMPPGINGYRYIFDARDNLTGFVDGCAVRERTGSVLAECIEEYYLRYPFIQEIVMDRGGEFRAKEVQTLLKRLGGELDSSGAVLVASAVYDEDVGSAVQIVPAPQVEASCAFSVVVPTSVPVGQADEGGVPDGRGPPADGPVGHGHTVLRCYVGARVVFRLLPSSSTVSWLTCSAGRRVSYERLKAMAKAMRYLLAATMWIMRMVGDDPRSHYDTWVFVQLSAKTTLLASMNRQFDARRHIMQASQVMTDKFGRPPPTFASPPVYIPDWASKCGVTFSHDATLASPMEARRLDWLGTSPPEDEDEDDDGADKGRGGDAHDIARGKGMMPSFL